MQAIETVYKGYRFRSRLEARWAVFFDAMGIKWEYEKEGYDLDGVWYLPDFWLPLPETSRLIHRHAGLWLEVKGDNPSMGDVLKLVSLTRNSKHTGYLVVGIPGDQRTFYCPREGHERWTDEEPAISPETELYILGTWFDKGWKAVDDAISASRQARFEFGENGRPAV